METYTILAIDEDRETWRRIATYLEERGMEVLIAESAGEAYRFLEEDDVDMVLLDESISHTDYLEVIRDIKARHTLPLFVLSPDRDPPDKITCIELGAEDYISKPIDASVLAAKIKSQLKLIHDVRARARHSTEPRRSRGVKFAQWILDFDRHELRHAEGGPVELTTGELDILKMLVQSAGKVLSREQLFSLTRGRDSDSFNRAIDVQISRIRQKLNHTEGDLIRTVRGVGYMLDVETEEIS